ncbi:MAG: hypothetical protein ABIR58_05525 [Gemmatimonadaceae bacterium]
MADSRITRVGWLAIGLAVVGGLVALVNEATQYRSSGVIDWGHVALAFGVPILMCGIVRGTAQRQP